jgi:RHS repeat-associated protein
VTKRFFNGGEQVSGTNYYFTRDHLGSVREMTDTTGTIKTRYDYDPFGRQIKTSGTMDSDFGYAGMYSHSPSGLSLTLFRAYCADLGRWLSRDPLAEKEGFNLYAYVLNNPINFVDLYGLSINVAHAAWAMIGIGAGLVGLAAGVATAEFGVGFIVATWSGYSLGANLQNLSNALNGSDEEQTTGLAQAIGEAWGGKGSDAAKMGEVGDLLEALIDPGMEETALQKFFEDSDDMKSAVDAIDEALDDLGVKDWLNRYMGPIRGCPAGSTGDVWDYINQLSAGEALL